MLGKQPLVLIGRRTALDGYVLDFISLALRYVDPVAVICTETLVVMIEASVIIAPTIRDQSILNGFWPQFVSKHYLRILGSL